VIGDYRNPDRLRLGLAPIYTSFSEVYQAMFRLRDILDRRAHLDFPTERNRVT
jgi:kynureninase